MTYSLKREPLKAQYNIDGHILEREEAMRDLGGHGRKNELLGTRAGVCE